MSRLSWMLFAVSVASCSQEQHSGHHGKDAPTTGNVVQVEMRLLNDAMEAAVRGIGVGDVKEVSHLLHKVHAAKETTAAAIQKGTYKPPKNSENLARFSALDVEFHHSLEGLVEASQANDINKTIDAMSNALRACQPCHSEFK